MIAATMLLPYRIVHSEEWVLQSKPSQNKALATELFFRHNKIPLNS